MAKYLIVPGKNVMVACEGCGNVVDLSDCAPHKIREGIGTFAVLARKRAELGQRDCELAVAPHELILRVLAFAGLALELLVHGHERGVRGAAFSPDARRRGQM